MNSRRIIFAILATLTLVVALWTMFPATSNAQSTPTAKPAAAASLSASGKITAVGNDSFTLALGEGQTPGAHQFSAGSEAKSMTFMIDKNTTIEGKLRVNANAEVTYREENGKNIAISVHVAS